MTVMKTLSNALFANLVCKADKHIVVKEVKEFVCDHKGSWKYDIFGRPVMRAALIAELRNGRDSYQTTLRMSRALRIGSECTLAERVYKKTAFGWSLVADLSADSAKDSLFSSSLDFLNNYTFF